MIFTHPTCELCGTKHMQGQHCWTPSSVSDRTTPVSQDVKASGVKIEDIWDMLERCARYLKAQYADDPTQLWAHEWLSNYKALKERSGR